MQQLPFLSVGLVLAPLCSLFTCSDEGLALEMSASNSFTVSSFVTLTLSQFIVYVCLLTQAG